VVQELPIGTDAVQMNLGICTAKKSMIEGLYTDWHRWDRNLGQTVLERIYYVHTRGIKLKTKLVNISVPPVPLTLWTNTISATYHLYQSVPLKPLNHSKTCAISYTYQHLTTGIE